MVGGVVRSVLRSVVLRSVVLRCVVRGVGALVRGVGALVTV